jgi:hypothetical protein
MSDAGTTRKRERDIPTQDDAIGESKRSKALVLPCAEDHDGNDEVKPAAEPLKTRYRGKHVCVDGADFYLPELHEVD